MVVMSAARFAIGLLPTYQAIGIAAPVLLVVLRLIQVVAVGGEWGGSTLVVTNHA